jgi:Sjoegren syndrome nuclear autoantigen 1
MTQQGATLQNYNNELVKCIEDLREKREEVNRSIAKDEEEKAKIQNDLRILTERLARINDNLARKITSRNEYDKTIQETEAAYSKVRPSPLCGGFLAPLPQWRWQRVTASATPSLSLRFRGSPVSPTCSARRSWRARKRCCTC